MNKLQSYVKDYFMEDCRYRTHESIAWMQQECNDSNILTEHFQTSVNSAGHIIHMGKTKALVPSAGGWLLQSDRHASQEEAGVFVHRSHRINMATFS